MIKPGDVIDLGLHIVVRQVSQVGPTRWGFVFDILDGDNDRMTSAGVQTDIDMASAKPDVTPEEFAEAIKAGVSQLLKAMVLQDMAIALRNLGRQQGPTSEQEILSGPVEPNRQIN